MQYRSIRTGQANKKSRFFWEGNLNPCRLKSIYTIHILYTIKDKNTKKCLVTL
jgi:hypothetical protein